MLLKLTYVFLTKAFMFGLLNLHCGNGGASWVPTLSYYRNCFALLYNWGEAGPGGIGLSPQL